MRISIGSVLSEKIVHETYFAPLLSKFHKYFHILSKDMFLVSYFILNLYMFEKIVYVSQIDEKIKISSKNGTHEKDLKY